MIITYWLLYKLQQVINETSDKSFGNFDINSKFNIDFYKSPIGENLHIFGWLDNVM